MDSRIPLEVIGEATYSKAYPGATVNVEIPVHRHIDRHCSLLFSRYMFDSNRSYRDLMATRFLSHEGWKNVEAINPGMIRYAVEFPEKMPLGEADVITQNSFMCNPLQYIWPVDFDIHTKIMVGEKP